MRGQTPWNGRFFSLRVTIGTLFVSLVLILGISLGIYNYRQTSEILIAGSNKLFTQMGNEIRTLFNGTYDSVSQVVNLLGHSQVVTGLTLDERLQALDLFAAALRNAPQLSGLQVGYDNGDYFIVRLMVNPVLRKRFSPPPGARINVDSITADGEGRRRLTRLWFDDELREVLREEPVDTSFDPRQRPWYRAALTEEAEVLSDPYLFYFTGKVGVTVSYQAPLSGAVVAADVILDQLSELLAGHPLALESELVVLSDQGQVLACKDPSRLIKRQDDAGFELATLADLDNGVLQFFARHHYAVDVSRIFSYDGQDWFGVTGKLQLVRKNSGILLMLTPKRVLLHDAIRGQIHNAVISLIIIAVAAFASWLVSKRISHPISLLADEAKRLSRFDFSREIGGRSHIREVNDLVSAMSLMKTTINRFLNLIQSLAEVADVDRLLGDVGRETMEACLADGVLVYLVDQREQVLRPGAAFAAEGRAMNVKELPSFALDGEEPLIEALNREESSVLELRVGGSETANRVVAVLDRDALLCVALPLVNRQRQKIGLLCILYASSRDELAAKSDQLAFVRALSGFVAVTLESRQLVQMQKELFDALVKLIAGAIDAKSPYTGGHCQRVPVLAAMLAEAACKSNSAPFAGFQLSSEEWEELHIASWLHDCGKVTTPEHVVDKATKLETLYDRIHEIRTRFEVLKRDARIRYWEALANGGDRDLLASELQEEWRQLDDEYAFVAQCNIGGERLDPEAVARLARIGSRTWTRTLDDRLGISWEELARKGEAGPLPATEPLLADKGEHLISRPAKELIAPDNPYGFRLQVPDYKFNLGELHNLGVERGTLTEEERYLVNDHIVQTIIMLSRLPYPPHLKEVPVIAGSHHEKMDGTGYPRRLSAEQQPMTARMMVIADVFEALTASDRPYKKAKTLSEAVRIMAGMAASGHIDPDLFQLFLEEGVYRTYAERFLLAEQLDAVDIGICLEGTPLAG